jgi:hypothetical protein
MAANPFLAQALTSDQLSQEASAAGSWLWYGYLKAGKITLLTSQWKCGKSTLIAHLLSCMARGGELAGLPVAAGRAAVISEEGPDYWAMRARRLQMGHNFTVFCRPFTTLPTMEQWQSLVNAMQLLRDRDGLDLVVIDPLVMFLPANSENTAELIVEWLLPLDALTSRGISVLLVHHPRKGKNRIGQAARGSGALPSHVDILIEMGWLGNPANDDRRRWLRAFSRFEETRKNLIIQQSADGTDYQARGTGADDCVTDCWDIISLVLEDAGEPLTVRQITEVWPGDFCTPDKATLSRNLRRALKNGLVFQEGAGNKSEPYTYSLAGRGREGGEELVE